MRMSLLFLLIVLMSCSKDKRTVKIKGSDTEVNLAVMLAESFHEENSKMLLSVSGGGSGLGIASLLNGTADIANSSRKINSEELELFNEKGIKLDSFIFAQDAIAFVVSDEVPLDSIHINDLAKLLSGEYNNWSKLTRVDRPISIYGRQSNSGTYEYIKNILKIKFSPYAKQMNGNAQILEAIKSDNSGMGYVGTGYVMNSANRGFKILKIYTENSSAVSPLDEAKIASGQYFFQRPLFQYFRKEDKQRVQPFLDFEKGSVGGNIIKSSGYYPNMP